MTDDDIRRSLGRIEAKLDLLLSDAGFEAITCPHCGADRLEDTSTSEGPRMTCLTCGKSFATTPQEVAANG